MNGYACNCEKKRIFLNQTLYSDDEKQITVEKSCDLMKPTAWSATPTDEKPEIKRAEILKS